MMLINVKLDGFGLYAVGQHRTRCLHVCFGHTMAEGMMSLVGQRARPNDNVSEAYIAVLSYRWTDRLSLRKDASPG